MSSKQREVQIPERQIAFMDRIDDPLLKCREVEELLGLHFTTIYKKLREEADFPKPYYVGIKAVRWSKREVLAWRDRRARSYGEASQRKVQALLDGKKKAASAEAATATDRQSKRSTSTKRRRT